MSLSAPRVDRLGHVGIFCNDVSLMREFYTDIIGLAVADEKAGRVVFLSSRPDEEHHELVLIGGRTAAADAVLLQQVSFRCSTLDDVVGYYQRLRDAGVRFDMIVSHGNAVGVYFYDPEGNRIEVYWDTGHKVTQPFLHAIDLEQPVEVVRAAVDEIVEKYGKTGFLDPNLSAAQRRGAKEGMH